VDGSEAWFTGFGGERTALHASENASRAARHFEMGKTPNILPVASVKRKLSGSRPGWRLTTFAARALASAITWISDVSTEVSRSTGTPLLSQSIANMGRLPGKTSTSHEKAAQRAAAKQVYGKRRAAVDGPFCALASLGAATHLLRHPNQRLTAKPIGIGLACLRELDYLRGDEVDHGVVASVIKLQHVAGFAKRVAHDLTELRLDGLVLDAFPDCWHDGMIDLIGREFK
jgi:hypothetical protein